MYCTLYLGWQAGCVGEGVKHKGDGEKKRVPNHRLIPAGRFISYLDRTRKVPRSRPAEQLARRNGGCRCEVLYCGRRPWGQADGPNDRTG